MENEENIVEAYIRINKQLIILVSGVSGCGKTSLAKDIERDFNLKFIDQYDFFKKDYNETYKLSTGEEIINWYTEDAIDWDKMNETIINNADKGVIVTGVSFPIEKLNFKTDYHIFVGRPKQECLRKRSEYIAKFSNRYKYENNNPNFEKIKFNKLEFPFVLQSQKKANIDKFINGENLSSVEVYDIAFDFLINSIQKSLP
tara:strand:- start:2975 stop:3577 length:603 start_codon:yes stop_codon:yes gene_type:complete